MHSQTKRNRKTKNLRRTNQKTANQKTANQRTKKITQKTNIYLGGGEGETMNMEKSKGIFDILSEKIGNYAGDTFDYVKSKGLRLAGLQPIRIDENNSINATKEVDANINKVSDAASGLVSGAKQIGSNVVTVFDKGSAAVVENINDVLGSKTVEKSVTDAAKETAAIGEKLLENINEKISTPELKEETKKVLENAADYAEIAVEAMDEPINKAVDELNKAGTAAAAGIASGVVKVGTDALAAVPGVGAVIEVGKMANDASAAAGDVVKAASDASSTISRVVEETSKNIEEGLEKKELEGNAVEKNVLESVTPNDTNNMKGGMKQFKEINKGGMKIYNRVNNSINQFENPFITSGGSKTRRKLRSKPKPKTKRVRFAI